MTRTFELSGCGMVRPPKGHNRTKMLKFRQYMLEHVRQLHIPEREGAVRPTRRR